jgi:hypothetical protein
MMDFEVALPIVVLNFEMVIALVTMNFQTAYCIENFPEKNQYEGLINFQTLNKTNNDVQFRNAKNNNL